MGDLPGLANDYLGALIVAALVIGLFWTAILLCRTRRTAEFFTDDSGKRSMGRLLMFFVTVAYVLYAGYMSFQKGQFVDMPVGVVGFVAGLYAGNKFSPTLPFAGEGGR